MTRRGESVVMAMLPGGPTVLGVSPVGPPPARDLLERIAETLAGNNGGEAPAIWVFEGSRITYSAIAEHPGVTFAQG